MVKLNDKIEEELKAIFNGDIPWVTIVWDDPVNLMTYVRQNKIQTVLDFPFQAKATEYASGYSNAAALTAGPKSSFS